MRILSILKTLFIYINNFVFELSEMINFVFEFQSPYWLARKMKHEKAVRSLTRIIGANRREKISDTLQEIAASINCSSQSTTFEQVSFYAVLI